MTISRREALAGLTAGAALTTMAGCTDNSAHKDKEEASPLNLPDMPSSLFLNKARAADILAQSKVDLLICSEPLNVYYLASHRPMVHRLGMGHHAYATLSAKSPDRPTLITGRIDIFLGGPGDSGVFNELDYKLFSIPEDPAAFSQLTEAQDIINAPVNQFFYPKMHDDYPLAPHIKRKRELDAKATREHFASMDGALLKQIFETDMPNKTVAIDHPRIRSVLEKSGLDLRIVDGERLVKKIRMQKTAAELDIHRYAISANVSAARRAAKSIADGATLQEMRGEFYKACGEHTTIPVYMLIDTIIPELAHGEIKRGRSVLIDCVSEFQGYHGDFGRTVGVGEPTAEIKKITDGLSFMWDRILPQIKAGTKYSDLHALSLIHI